MPRKDQIAVVISILSLLLLASAWTSIQNSEYCGSKKYPNSTPIPFVGMSLLYKFVKIDYFGNLTVTNNGSNSIVYTQKLSSEVFKLTAKEELHTYDLELNVSSRIYLAGQNAGEYVGHWIGRNGTGIGKSIVVNPFLTMNITSVQSISLPSLNSTIQAFEAVASSQYNGSQGITYNTRIIKYFDTTFGLLVKDEVIGEMEGGPGGQKRTAYNYTSYLADSGSDNDKDGFTDFHEMFIAHTDPLSACNHRFDDAKLVRGLLGSDAYHAVRIPTVGAMVLTLIYFRFAIRAQRPSHDGNSIDFHHKVSYG